ncbi:general odorant-binding protein 84a [Contarinia nasturtii]|uniref:general odorant-binding protein 84a n=1 Tax=Contarinia nasturtii TaxID=265458 RepID=UPI0012D465EB|nr:general odorant-binding protein 84a [Contarinia nasturtii]
MTSTKFFIGLVIVLFSGCAQCCFAADTEQQPAAPAVKMVDKTAVDQLDQMAIMQHCNESFRTTMEYLEDLNSTGSFPDETDKTPMCYIRCYLDAVGILKDDELNLERANEMQWSTCEETIPECQKEVADRTNPCEKAYFLTRCVMMRNIVDMRITNE